jgi:hypothetical protein
VAGPGDDDPEDSLGNTGTEGGGVGTRGMLLGLRGVGVSPAYVEGFGATIVGDMIPLGFGLIDVITFGDGAGFGGGARGAGSLSGNGGEASMLTRPFKCGSASASSASSLALGMISDRRSRSSDDSAREL